MQRQVHEQCRGPLVLHLLFAGWRALHNMKGTLQEQRRNAPEKKLLSERNEAEHVTYTWQRPLRKRAKELARNLLYIGCLS